MGGSAAVVTTGHPKEPVELETLMQKGAHLTCSYGEEEDAMSLAFDWLEQHTPSSALIITDSQSLCQGLINFKSELEPLLKRLQRYPNNLNIQWVPGHCGITGNELADKAAKQATKLEATHAPVSYQAVRAEIRRVTKDPPATHDRSRRVYSCISQAEESKVKNRKDQTLLAKVRSGHTVLFKSYLDKHTDHVDPIDPLCPLCFQEKHDLVHWMTKCGMTLGKRQEIFGWEEGNDLEVLTKYPEKAVALIRSFFPDA